MMTDHGKVISPPVLTLRRHDGKFTLDTNICSVQVGCVLVEEQENETNRPIRCFRSIHDSQRAYDTMHRKCYAEICEMLLFRPNSKERRLTIRFDHDFSRRNLNMADATDMLVQRRLRLAETDLVISRGQGSESSSVRTINTQNQRRRLCWHQ